MARSTQRVLPVNLVDELHEALNLIAAVADLLALATLDDPGLPKDATISRAARLIESEASRLRHLLRQAEGIPSPNLPTTPDDDAI